MWELILLIVHEGLEVQSRHMIPLGAPLQLQLLRKEYPVTRKTTRPLIFSVIFFIILSCYIYFRPIRGY